MELVLVEKEIYIPTFCTETGQYLDKSPYKPYQRNRIPFECRCKAGAIFTDNNQFKKHIATKVHVDFINNYSKYYKEVDEAKVEIVELKIDNELIKRKHNTLKSKHNQLLLDLENIKEELDAAKELIKEQERDKKHYSKLIHQLRNNVKEKKRNITDDDEDEFLDCTA